MKPTSTRRSLLRTIHAGLCLIAPVSAHAAEEPKDKLEPLIVSALSVPQEASTVTSAVTVLDPGALQNQGILQLRDALNASPGVISTSTSGETGAVGTIFIRGTTTADSQIVIDGMRLSDSNSSMASLLAAGRTYDVGNIEVLRGPQGAIYGGESIGGVLWMETPYGSGKPHGSATIEGGSFQSLSAHSMFQGQTGELSYYLSGGYETTDNDGPQQGFHQGNTALRVEGKINSIWTVGSTFRAVDSFYENSGTSDDHLDASLFTLYATGKISNIWTARFHAGFVQESYDSDYIDPWTFPSKLPTNYATDLQAGSISTNHEITLADNLRLLAGAFVRADSYESRNHNSSSTSVYADENGDRYGAHAALEWDPVENLTTTAALRWEDYDSFGDELTWRFGAIYRLEKSGTSFRAGVGRSFRAPSYQDLYHNSFWYYGNPDLKAQTSIGWDVGIEQKIGDHHTVEAIWFNNNIDDAINSYYYDSVAGKSTAVNLPGDTTTDGLEVGLRGSWLNDALGYRLAWTYLHESLKDQPRNAATAALDWKPTTKALVGIGATTLSDHSWGGDPLASYTIVRLHGSYQVTDRVKVHARIENALNESYELYSGFGTVAQGGGTGFYGGVTVDW